MRIEFEFLTDEQIYRKMMREEIPSARESVLIATALVKQTQVEIRKGEFGPFLELADELIRRRVSVSILLAGKPTKGFLESIAKFPKVASEMSLRVCARNHMKIVLIDRDRLYLGSANLTGAGMGRKGNDRRNFEFGLYTSDPRLIRRVSEVAEQIWLQVPCRTCRATRLCAYEHHRIAQSLQQLGAQLRQWPWPTEVTRYRADELGSRARAAKPRPA